VKKLPKAVVKRLPVYFRGLKRLKEQGHDKILSSELSEYLNIESTTIRRDFSYLGDLGRQGYGYDIDKVLNVLEKELQEDTEKSAILIGAGHLGTALINYNFVRDNFIQITKAFDVNESKIGSNIADVNVYDISELKNKIDHEEIAILAVPSEAANMIVPILRETNIKGVLNFSSARFSGEKKLLIQNVDLTSELHSLAYFVKNR
jgi:redox-sensing transcriptional repressor